MTHPLKIAELARSLWHSWATCYCRDSHLSQALKLLSSPNLGCLISDAISEKSANRLQYKVFNISTRLRRKKTSVDQF